MCRAIQAEFLVAPRRPIVLQLSQILVGHAKIIETAKLLMDAATPLLSTSPEIALSLFQVGEEEIGKSFLLLAACGYQEDLYLWSDFWLAWRTHDRKVALAFRAASGRLAVLHLVCEFAEAG